MAERLEVDFTALRTVAARNDPPTLRDLIRRMLQLQENGERPVVPSITWLRTRLQANRVFGLDDFEGCRCAVLISRRKPPGRNALGSNIGADAFFVGFKGNGTVLCVGPSDPVALLCERAPKEFGPPVAGMDG